MHNNLFDVYQEKESLLHRLEPRVKVLTTVGFILSNAFLPDSAWMTFTLAWMFLLVSMAFARVRVGYILKRSLLALPFALAVITVLFPPAGENGQAIQVGPFSLVVYIPGVVRFISIMLRAWLSVQAALLLVVTTRFPDLVHALEHLHLPKLLMTVVAFLYRYLFVLGDEAMRLIHARQARSALQNNKVGRGTLKWRAQVTGNLVGQLFLRSYERSERIHHAMQARGYSGQIRTMQSHMLKSRDWLFLTAGCLVIVLLQILGSNH